MTINKTKTAKQLKGMSPGELKARTGSSIKNKQTNAKLARSYLSDMMGKYKKKKEKENKMSPGERKARTGSSTRSKLAYQLAKDRKSEGRLTVDDIKRALKELKKIKIKIGE